MKFTVFTFILSFLGVFSFETSSDKPAPISVFETLHGVEIRELTIVTDLGDLIEGEGKEKYVPAHVSYHDNQGNAMTWQAEARQRGKSRRRYCDFPPIKLRFDKDELAQRGMAPFHTLKLVSHCSDNSFESQEQVIKEYLAYKMYNQLTDASFKAQLVRITWIDNSRKRPRKMKRYGIILENHDEMAARLGGEVCDCLNPDLATVDAKAESRMALYQFLISNTDYDLRMMRNLKLVTFKDDRKAIPVPYDFDFSGLVQATYAIPNPDYEQLYLRDRLLLSRNPEPWMVTNSLSYFHTKRTGILEEIQQVPLLSVADRSDLLEFVDSFFYDYDAQKITATSPFVIDTVKDSIAK